MTRVDKVYGFILPLSSEEYTRGNKYGTIIKAMEDKKTGTRIELVERSEEHHELLGFVRKTVKRLHLHNKIPSLVRKLIPDKACVIKETSYSSTKKIRTVYHNSHFSKALFSVTIDTVNVDGDVRSNPFDFDTLEYHDITPPSSLKRSICYKHVSVEINKYMLGWVAYEIDKSIRTILIDHHTNIIQKKEEWHGISLEELEAMETETFKCEEI